MNKALPTSPRPTDPRPAARAPRARARSGPGEVVGYWRHRPRRETPARWASAASRPVSSPAPSFDASSPASASTSLASARSRETTRCPWPAAQARIRQQVCRARLTGQLAFPGRTPAAGRVVEARLDDRLPSRSYTGRRRLGQGGADHLDPGPRTAPGSRAVVAVLVIQGSGRSGPGGEQRVDHRRRENLAMLQEPLGMAQAGHSHRRRRHSRRRSAGRRRSTSA